MRQVFRPKLTVQYPEVQQRHHARATAAGCMLLYDERGTLKCETCFQCAQACPIECIDMGGVDTRDRYHVHWGARRDSTASAARSRPCAAPAGPCPTAPSTPSSPSTWARSTRSWPPSDYEPAPVRWPSSRQTQGAYGHLPVAALQHIAHQTGAGYAVLYGIATSYPHLHFEPPVGHVVRVCRCAQCTVLGADACWQPSASTSAPTSAA